jgi:hypothetical protein
MYKNDHFAKTGSGQTYKKNSKKDAVFRTCRIFFARSWSSVISQRTASWWPRSKTSAGCPPSAPADAAHFSLRKSGPFFECVPYVCPEPALVKCSFLYMNGSKRPFLLTGILGRSLWHTPCGSNSQAPPPGGATLCPDVHRHRTSRSPAVGFHPARGQRR